MMGFESSDVPNTIAQYLYSTATTFFAPNENVEAEVFADMAHVALDLATFVSTGTVALRFALFLGRLFSIASDYVPDHHMSLDECVFQFSMLSLSAQKLLKVTLPLVDAQFKESPRTSFKDRRMYHSQFLRAGFTWLQYKYLLSSGALEWIQLSPSSWIVLENEELNESIFLLHKGEANLQVGTSKIQQYSTRPNKEGRMSMIADLAMARKLIDPDRTTLRSPQVYKSSGDELTTRGPITNSSMRHSHLWAGPNGALLLRIHTKCLMDIMADDDDNLADCIRRLIFLGVQEKLSKMLLEDKTSRNDMNSSNFSTFITVT